MPIMTTSMITTIVEAITSLRESHVTFLSSAMASFTNCTACLYHVFIEYPFVTRLRRGPPLLQRTGAEGFEPSRPVLETGSLPLAYAPAADIYDVCAVCEGSIRVLLLRFFVHGMLAAGRAELFYFELAFFFLAARVVVVAVLAVRAGQGDDDPFICH